jgi:hypothetical protein
VLPILVATTVVPALLGACSDDTTDHSSDIIDTTDTIDTTGGPDAGASEPAQACGLLDPAAVDGWLGTTGVTGAQDTSLGLFDGCRWATAATDVPELLVGYGPTMEFEQVRDLACEGTTAEPATSAGADAVACFGAVVARAGEGVVLVSVEDSTGGLDEAAQLDIATRAAVAITGNG